MESVSETMLAEASRLLSSQGLVNRGNGRVVCGVDIGTSSVVLFAVDPVTRRPVAGAMQPAEVVREGLVVDYARAVSIVKELKTQVESALQCEIEVAATGYPPGVSRRDAEAKMHVVESAGFDIRCLIDEPTAANAVLGITDGAIIDVGGGTTGIAVFSGGHKVYGADEPTGGTHMTLVIAGAKKIPFAEAEKIKVDPVWQEELFPLIVPVVEKISEIVCQHIRPHRVERLHLVGGGASFHGMDRVIERYVGIPTTLWRNSRSVTPLGIALSCPSEPVR